MTEPAEGAPPEGAWDQEWVEAFLRCARCSAPKLRRAAGEVRCPSCGHSLPVTDPGLLTTLPPPPPSLRADAGARPSPLPAFEGIDSVGDLLSRAFRSRYAAVLDRQIPPGARILEAGCLTGELGLFLSVGGRAVVCADRALAPLRAAAEFKRRHGLSNCNLLHGSAVDLPCRDETFDLVICQGALRHSTEPAVALRAILRMLRPGGYLICSLYNRAGRMPVSLRRLGSRLFRGTPRDPDRRRPDATEGAGSSERGAAPAESRQTIDQVLGWFEQCGIEFLRGVPPVRFGERWDPSASLFRRAPRGSRIGRWMTQAGWMLTAGRHGGVFDLIGRKRGG